MFLTHLFFHSCSLTNSLPLIFAHPLSSVIYHLPTPPTREKKAGMSYLLTVFLFRSQSPARPSRPSIAGLESGIYFLPSFLLERKRYEHAPLRKIRSSALHAFVPEIIVGFSYTSLEREREESEDVDLAKGWVGSIFFITPDPRVGRVTGGLGIP